MVKIRYCKWIQLERDACWRKAHLAIRSSPESTQRLKMNLATSSLLKGIREFSKVYSFKTNLQNSVTCIHIGILQNGKSLQKHKIHMHKI